MTCSTEYVILLYILVIGEGQNAEIVKEEFVSFIRMIITECNRMLVDECKIKKNEIMICDKKY